MNIIASILSFIRKKILNIDTRTYLQQAIDNGLKLGTDSNIQDNVIINPSHAWLIQIGDRVTIAPRVYILAHDASTKRLLDYTVIGKVIIGNDVFIGANSIILPNTTIGNNVIIGAGSVVTNSIPDNSVAVGNPAKVISSFDNYQRKRLEQFTNSSAIFDESFTLHNITKKQKQLMFDLLKDNIGFVK